MRKVFMYAAILIAFTMILGCGGREDNSEIMRNMVAAVADHAELLFENEHVAAIKFELDPGDKLPAHECSEHVVYALSSFEITSSLNQEQSQEILRRGQAYWRGACTHSAENTGKTDARYIVVTRKSSDLPEPDSVALTNSLAVLAPDNTVTLVDNDRVRVVETILNPGQRLPGHTGINRLVYSLNSYEVTYRDSPTDRYDVAFRKGDINWYDAGPYSIANIGKSPAHFLVFEFIR